MNTCRWAALAGALALAGAACSEPSAGPPKGSARSPQPVFLVAGAATCPTPANFIVTDEASLLAALAAASPGNVIGLNGFFGLTSELNLNIDNLTLTCARPGSGLFAQPGSGIVDLVNVLAKGVTVDRLVLDGSAAADGPYVAFNNGATAFAADVRFTNNTVTCGAGVCAFFVGVKGAIVTDNHLTSAGSVTGIHLQGQGTPLSTRPTDGSRVERNTIVATAPSTNPVFGGIRPRDGSNVVVSNNIVIGPWANSLSPSRISQSVIEGNRLERAGIYGIGMSFNPTTPISMTDNAIRNNRITGAGTAGVFASRACRNVFVGNNLQGNADNMGVIFTAMSGANTLVGNQNVVVDIGAFDCNGDGVNDPNIITGRAAVKLGETVSNAIVTSNGLR